MTADGGSRIQVLNSLSVTGSITGTKGSLFVGEATTVDLVTVNGSITGMETISIKANNVFVGPSGALTGDEGSSIPGIGKGGLIVNSHTAGGSHGGSGGFLGINLIGGMPYGNYMYPTSFGSIGGGPSKFCFLHSHFDFFLLTNICLKGQQVVEVQFV